MKCLFGVLALSVTAAVAVAEPEADAQLHFVRPYYASGYAGPLPGYSYQAVHRLHRRDADAEPQFVSAAAVASPLVYTHAALPAAVHAVNNLPVVKSVVEIPAEVSTTPLLHHTPLTYTAAPLHYPVHYTAAAPVVSAPVAAGLAVAGLGPLDCVTEAGCAVKTALLTGAPAASYGSATVAGRRRRDAESDPEAEADADAAYLYNSAYNAYNAYPFNYNLFPYSYNPLAYLNNYEYNVAPAISAPYVAAPAVTTTHIPAPVAVAPAVATTHVAAPVAAVHHAVASTHVSAPVVAAHHAFAAPIVAARVPQVHTVAKEVTYTHLGAHPITPTTVLQTESKLVL